MTDGKSQYKEVIKSFFLAFKRLSLYAVDHPLSKEILTNLFTMFSALLKVNTEILIAAGSNVDEMVVNNEALDAEVLGAHEIYEKYRAFKLDGVSFLPGLTYEELTQFIQAMAMPTMLDGGKPAPVPEMLKGGSEHIVLKKLRYEKIEEDEKVVSKDVTGMGAGPGGGMGGGMGGPGGGMGQAFSGDVFSGIREFLSGSISDLPARPDTVLEEMDHNVTRVTQAILDSARESGDFEGVIKKFVSWVSKHMAPMLVEKKKDPGKFVQKLFDSFEKEELARYPQSSQVIEACADDIKMAMIEGIFATQRDNPKKAFTATVKILVDEEDQKRLLPRLSGRLVSCGATFEEAQGFVQKVETELTKDEDVTISKKKLSKLMKISERYDQELERRVRHATDDLTRVNRRLSAEKERSDEVMRHLADGLVVVDREGKVVMMNPAAEKLLGRGMKEALGKSLVEELKDGHLLAVAKGPLDDKDETRITKEIELDSKDENTKKILRASSAVVENEDGKTVGMVSVLSDITREKEVDEMKSHFVSLVTHELRTPVVAIQKSLELILSQATGSLNEDQARFLSISKFNLERLNRLINDLLDMSKLEAGKMTINPVSFDLKVAIDEVSATLASWAKDKEITFKSDVRSEPLMVYADKDRIVQVLVNLVGNALKFTPVKGEVTVTAETLEKRPGICEAPCVQVTVADTGIGIDPKDFKRIFNKFEQVTLVSPSGSGGTGLGLPIAKEIINLHNGTIWAEGQKGAGSRFVFVLPQQSKPKK